MARIFVTGSADGLGRAAAQTLLGQGHQVIVHARSAERVTAVHDLIRLGAEVVVGDLSDLIRPVRWPIRSTSSVRSTP